MEESKTKNKFFKKIDTGLLIGISAMIISIATLFVYIYQASIMKEQLHTAVWPYIEWSKSNYKAFYIEVQNKGIGPAIIKDSRLFVDGKVTKDLTEFFDLLLKDKKSKMEYISSYVNGRVMSPGESFRPFSVMDSVFITRLDSAFQTHAIRFEICYCSVYGDCWTSKGTEVVKSHCN